MGGKFVSTITVCFHHTKNTIPLCRLYHCYSNNSCLSGRYHHFCFPVRSYFEVMILSRTCFFSSSSRMFSMNLGLLFIGFALGPTLGGLLIRFTQQTIYVFYVGALIHMLYAFMIWFIVPESNSQKKMQRARAKYQEEVEQSQRAREGASILIRGKRLFSFLTPLAVFNPVPMSENSLKPPRRDWSLALIALSYAFTVSVVVSIHSNIQSRWFVLIICTGIRHV